MPPKKEEKQLSKEEKKALLEKKQRAAEEKTFGLKNKSKSRNVQQFVKTVERGLEQSKAAVDAKAKAEGEKRARQKAAELAAKNELSNMLKTQVKQQKVPEGVDPKSVLCEFFKAGACTKGSKCKFSHDLQQGRKTEKADLFSDARDKKATDGEPEPGMEGWDQDELEKAIRQKHGDEKSNKTQIICKHFLDAIEKKVYGWFWVCPNGGKECKYRHGLPPGYLLKSQLKALAAEELANKKTVEQEIEEERRKLEASTPVTEAVFREWKVKKDAERMAKIADAKATRAREGRMTGRELIEAGFELFDDAGAGESSSYTREEDFAAIEAKMREEAERNLAAARADVGLSALLMAELEGLDDDEDPFADEGDGFDGAELAGLSLGDDGDDEPLDESLFDGYNSEQDADEGLGAAAASTSNDGAVGEGEEGQRTAWDEAGPSTSASSGAGASSSAAPPPVHAARAVYKQKEKDAVLNAVKVVQISDSKAEKAAAKAAKAAEAAKAAAAKAQAEKEAREAAKKEAKEAERAAKEAAKAKAAAKAKKAEAKKPAAKPTPKPKPAEDDDPFAGLDDLDLDELADLESELEAKVSSGAPAVDVAPEVAKELEEMDDDAFDGVDDIDLEDLEGLEAELADL